MGPNPGECAGVDLQEDVATLSQALCSRIKTEASRLRAEFGQPRHDRIRWCILDDVLPENAMRAAYGSLPTLSDMIRLKSMRERKFVSANLDKLDASVSDIVLAFTQPEFVDVIAGIAGSGQLEADSDLYNGGITIMLPGDFMRPHLDNSHDHARQRRRYIVLLYYITPYWLPAYQGTLELWSLGQREPQSVIAYQPNRLVVLETTNSSWHAVKPIVGPLPRVSVTSYLYESGTASSPVRLTRFTSWPREPLKKLLFSTQFHLRSAASTVIGRSIANQHIYKARRNNSTRPPERPVANPPRTS